MKQAFLFFSLLLLFGACRKTEYNYTVNCEVSSYAYRPRKLVITTSAGEVLQTVDIANGQTQINFDVAFKTKDELPDVFDAHLLIIDSASCSVYASSQLDVPNGASFYLGPVSQPFTQGFYTVKVEGLSSYDTIHKANLYESGLIKPFYDQTKQTVYFSFFEKNQRGATLRLKANGDPNYRSVCLLKNQLTDQDTITLNWQDFSPETDVRTVQLPGSGKALGLEVSALDAGQQYDALLKTAYFWEQPGPDISFVPSFSYPTGLPANTLLAIRVEQDHTAQERIFASNDPLIFSPPGMQINDVKISSQYAEVQSEGNALWLKAVVSFSSSTTCANVNMELAGTPASFAAGHQLPNFAGFLPGAGDIGNPQVSSRVSVIKYDLLQVEDIRKGYPDRDGKIFPAARAGYIEVWK